MNTGLNVNMIGSIEHRLETSGKLADRAENGRAETEKGMLDFSDVHSVEKKTNPLARGGSFSSLSSIPSILKSGWVCGTRTRFCPVHAP